MIKKQNRMLLMALVLTVTIWFGFIGSVQADPMSTSNEEPEVNEDAEDEDEVEDETFVDDIAPILSKVEYQEEQSVFESQNHIYHFYQRADEPKVSLEIIEANFDKETLEDEKSIPKLEITSETDNVSEPVWSFDGTCAATAVAFPGAESQETEYCFSLQYQDLSGNVLTGDKKYPCDENGVFYSDLIVVDDVPPELTKFEILSNGGEFIREGENDYAENLQEKDDLQILVSIKDHEFFFAAEAVTIEYSKDGNEWKKLEVPEDIAWTWDGKEHSTMIYFDGEEQEESSYQFRISYKDRANHWMVLSEDASKLLLETAQGTYQFFRKIVIDHQSPQLKTLIFEKPVQIYGEESSISNGILEDRIRNAETKLYYDKNITASFAVSEKFLKAENVQVKIFGRAEHKDSWEEIAEKTEIQKTEREGEGFYTLTFPAEDREYYFTVSYTDRAGNSLTYAQTVEGTDIGEAYENGIKEAANTYQSPIFVRDTKTPYYEIVKEQGTDPYNCVEKSQIILNCVETNLDMERSYIEIIARDVQGKVLSNSKIPLQEYEKFLNKQTMILELTEEANYEIRAELIDKVKKTKTYQKSFCIDRTPPHITVVTQDGKSYTNTVNETSGLLDLEKSDLAYSVPNDSGFSKVIDKLTFGYFSKETMIAHVKVHDEISGVAGLYISSLDADGKETTSFFSKTETIEENPGVIQYDIELPENFKGTVKAHGIDKTGNKGTDTGAIGVISETEEKHKAVSAVKLEILSSYSKTPHYYVGDVNVKFTVLDGHSGLYSVDYLAGNYQETVTYPSKEEIRLEEIKEYKLSAKENNANNLLFGLGMLDHAGYKTEVPKEELPVVHIDTTMPEIEVTYDLQEAENEYYYKESRIATVTITERNFDPEDTELEVTGPPVTISSWKHIPGSGCSGGTNPRDTNHRDSCQWVSTVEFSNDGNYTFTCRTTDLAGNEASYGRTDEFVIDQTLPDVKVTYDNQDVKNSFYYNDRRIAVIEITEKNFRASDVEITMTAMNQGIELPVPQVGSWSSEGNIHRARILYDYDGEFTFDIFYKDLAGNEAADYQEDYFIIDQTMPEIVIENVEHLSANNGAVAPRILWTDQNFDINGMALYLNGCQNGVIEYQGKKISVPHGVEYQMEDFAYVQEADDLYSLYVSVQDLAGNSSEATMLFSVNRFGSVYDFSKATERLVGQGGLYYTKEGQELTVIETNVDTLEFQEITLNHNGKLRTLEKEKDYIVLSSGHAESWKQYTYRIFKENFQNEGTYILTIYSEDRADNLSDNHSKGKKIEFVVDRTAPSVLVTGVENKGQYRTEWKEILLDVEDNVSMDRVEVLLNGERIIYPTEEVLEKNGRLVLRIQSQERWQSLTVTAFDKAGNESQTEQVEFLLTPNLWIQFYGNQPLFWGSLFILFMIFTILYLIVKNRRTKSTSTS